MAAQPQVAGRHDVEGRASLVGGVIAPGDQVKFAAEKQPPKFESSGPAKTIDEGGIDLLIGSL